MQITFVSPGSIAAALHLPRGVTAIVGGGGKTTLMQSLAEELSARARVVITTTTHIWVPDWAPVLLNPTEAAVIHAFLEHPGRPICVASPALSSKLCASDMPMEALMRLADYVLVIAVAGLDGIGHAIEQTAFRPERYAALLQTTVDHAITPKDAATVMMHELGLRKAVEPSMRFSIVLNKADDDRCMALADEIAKHIPQALAERVICTSFLRRNQHVGID